MKGNDKEPGIFQGRAWAWAWIVPLVLGVTIWVFAIIGIRACMGG